MWRRPVYQTLSKALDISSAKSWVFPDLLKALAILSDTTARRSAVDREDLKPYWKSQKRPKFSRWPKILLFASFSKTLLTKERRLTGQLFLAVNLFFPTFLNTGTTNESFQKSEKQDSFRHLLNFSSVPQFFRTTTGIPSGPLTNQGSLWPF